jgi:dihydrofolate reductase
VATATNGAIGNENALLWRLSADLKRFKALTTHHAVIMGRKTYESIGKPLPNRLNIVVSRQENLYIEGCATTTTIAHAIEIAQVAAHTEIFIIGGGEIYNQTLDICQKIYLTTVHTVPVVADTFFAMPAPAHWHKIHEEHHAATPPLNEFGFTFTDWVRR